ncbi:MAG: hypothetical protein HND44_02090 [Chloroflexi bacterium]|nr:hypothetical protein [Ardenticatenaceae bacterium]MBL1127289.1 hypothetical protein [Chloroflexota bacterium]NOG33350.1 hypothetical protein [Chloroflexota bacterium]GIK56174.1 MAG: hypothetical protein BroJett015_18370 [Chloroflexota bacterium]
MRHILYLVLLVFLLAACGGSEEVGVTATAVPLTTPLSPAADTAVTLAPSPTSLTESASLPATTHPRLWLTPADVEVYRAWANENNPLWRDGLQLLAERARADMNAGRVPDQDCGNIGYEEYPTEMYAELFAFLSLVDPDPAMRAEYTQRARTLLMYMMNLAAQGPASAENVVCNESQQYPPFRHPDFFTSDRDRARYHGEAFPLVVDWIYPALTAVDKTTIHQVFSRWSEEIITRGYHHPEPVGMVNDPQLLADEQQVRFAGNNYYAAHMRNLGLMALAMDAADDPHGELRHYLDIATGSYLYIFNHLISQDARGGLLPEGFEYSPQTASYVTQFLWALQSSQTPGAAAAFDHTFWSDFVTGYLHSISPGATEFDRDGELLWEYQPAWYGDAQDYRLPNFISSFGALGHLLTDPAALNAIRWSAIHTASGGETYLTEWVRNPNDFREAILYFMLLPPGTTPTDPRPAWPLDFYAPGLNRVFSRTGWDGRAAWFNYRLGWNSIDHQMADGNHFELLRNGEWLTKGRTGYANIAEGIASSEFYNTLTIGNDRPIDRDDSDWRIDLWRRGSQWNLVSDGDPTLLAYSTNSLFTYVTGDATPLYNSANEGATAVQHASRSLLWLKPDVVVVYDRAISTGEGYAKRWWLQLANPATVNGPQAISVTPGGQQLFVTVLLPAGASLQAVNNTEQYVEETIAHHEPMTVRLMTEAPGAPTAVQMLHILQGADGGATAVPATLLQSEEGLWEGAVVGGTAVLFAQTIGQPFPHALSYTAPANTTTHLITGLPLGSGYDVQIEPGAEGMRVTVQPGAQFQADEGGVLLIR